MQSLEARRNKLAYNKDIIFVIIILAFITTTGFIFEESDDFFDIDKHIIKSEDEIMDEDPFKNVPTRNNFDNETLQQRAIDPEEDLKISEIGSIVFILAGTFVVILIISLVIAIKKASNIVFVIMMALFVFIVIGIIFLIMPVGDIERELYSRNEKIWEAKNLETFVNSVSEETRIISQRDKDKKILTERFTVANFNENYMDKIINIVDAALMTGAIRSESIMIEFVDRATAEKFKEEVFESRRSYQILKGRYETGQFATNNISYRNGYLMQDNKFIFISFGEKPAIEKVFNTILSNYPIEYRLEDKKPPEIEILSQKTINKSGMKFAISDDESGLNQLDIIVLGAEFSASEDCRIDNIYNEKESKYVCVLKDIQEDENFFTIIVSDREKNNLKKEVEYILDTESPEIKVVAKNREDVRILVTDDKGVDEESIWMKADGKSINIARYCQKAAETLVCSIQLGDETTSENIQFKARDIAGNIAKAGIVIDITPPLIEFLAPIDIYSIDGNIEIIISDNASDIKEIKVSINSRTEDICTSITRQRYRCRTALSSDTNNNLIEIAATDVNNNIAELEKEIIIDNTPPEIKIIDYSENVIRFLIRDSISGIDTERITIEGNRFEITDICEKRNVKTSEYQCSLQIDLESFVRIIALDIAGNIQDSTLSVEG
ncbi:MAG: hypothetical protein ACOCUR_01715 [Nanoarchaeota archaeon]